MNDFNKERTIIKLNNDTIRKALKLFLENENEAIELYGHISDWDTSEVTDMRLLFGGAITFNQNIGSWDVSNVTNMQWMFGTAELFNNGGSDSIKSWNVSNVTTMYGMFFFAASFNQNIGSWDVSNVTNMREMFNNAQSFNNAGCNSIKSWNVSRVTNMISMFNQAYEFNQNIGKWPIKTNCVINQIKPNCIINQMFHRCPVTKKTFEGKLYGNKIAEYFELENPNEFMVWEPYTRWERRKNAVIFFSSVSKLNINEVDENQKTNELVKLIDIDDNIYKKIVSFI